MSAKAVEMAELLGADSGTGAGPPPVHLHRAEVCLPDAGKVLLKLLQQLMLQAQILLLLLVQHMHLCFARCRQHQLLAGRRQAADPGLPGMPAGTQWQGWGL